MQITSDLVSELQKLFENQQFSQLIFKIELLGNLDDMPNEILMMYACAKAMNKNTSKSEYKDIARWFDKILQSDSQNIDAYKNLIKASITAKYFKYIKKYIFNYYEANPKDNLTLECLALMHYYIGNMGDSSRFFKEYTDISPNDTSAWISYLGGLLYHNKLSQSEYLSECARFDSTVKKNTKKLSFKKSDKIRLCFLSPDFVTHPVAFFLKDVIKKIDKDKFELIALSNKSIFDHDKMTNELKSNFSAWYDIIDKTDEQVSELTDKIKIDILIDLAGYTKKSRIRLLGSRIAPIQISWLGYCNTLGLSNVDYLISDKNMIPEDEQNFYKEKIIYMPKVFAAHSLLEDKIEIRDKSLDKEFIYGSFNNLRKISDETFDVWSEILKTTNCKLLLRSSTHDTDELKENVLKKFKERRVDIDQIDIANTIKNRNEHLSSYNNINIALDPFPFPGATTTFESIYMGVPVLTLKGNSSISRFGVTINQNLALEEFIAVNKEEYIQKAVNFSQNKSFLNKISGNNLRNKILKSCLFNSDEFTEEIEKVLLNLIN